MKEQRTEERELRRAIGDNGGDRLERLGARDRRARTANGSAGSTRRSDTTNCGAGSVCLPSTRPTTSSRSGAFAPALRETAAEREAAVQNALNEAGVDFAQGRKEHDDLSAEIASLQARRSNIDAQQIAMRSSVVRRRLKLSEADMPFAGELLQVRDDERDWEGAAERLLRNFGLSLLVPDAHYPAVADWVDRTHLKGRLVYFRVRPARKDGRGDVPSLHPDSLVRKLALKPDSPFYDWLERELGAPLRHRLLHSAGAVPPRDHGDHARRPDQGPRRAPREGRPAPPRRPQPLRARLEQRRPRSPRCRPRHGAAGAAGRDRHPASAACRRSKVSCASGCSRSASSTSTAISPSWTGARSPRTSPALQDEKRALEAASDVLKHARRTARRIA